MSKVSEIVSDALQHLRVMDAGSAMDANDLASGIRALNAMMRAWEVDGISLGWSDVAAGDDEMPTPPEAEEAIGYGLAVRLRARYGVAADPDVTAMAEAGVSMLRAQVASTDYARCQYDDLPRGNNQRAGSWREAFYR